MFNDGRRLAFLLTLTTLPIPGAAAGVPADPKTSAPSSTERRGPAREVRIPGLVIDFDRRCVDLDARVLLDEGFLELVACTKDTKEHESLVVIDARPMHVHTALLALGATAGNPAMRRRIEDDTEPRWIDVPPMGGSVDVFLVVEGEKGRRVEHPISRFVTRDDPATDVDEATGQPPFPNTFLFTGSLLRHGPDGRRDYVCDEAGTVISIATFGDELLGLPEVHTRDNAALVWRVDPTHLPKVGTRVTLRLRPRSAKPSKPTKDSE